MIRILSIIPSWAYAAALAFLLTALGAQTVRLSSAHSTIDKERAAWAELVAKAEREAREQSEKNRAIEKELSDVQETHAAETAAIHADLDRARAAASAAAGGLRHAAQTAAERARKACAATSPAGVRETTDDAIGVLADVLGRIDERAGILADAADRAYIAGRACEREYDSAREALNRQ